MNNRFQWIIFRHISVLVILISLIAWAGIVNNNWLLAAMVGLILIFEIYWLFFELNQVHRKLAFFFDAIQNDDTSLQFPIDARPPVVGQLHASLNRVNQLIQEAKIRQSEQEQYFETAMGHVATGIITMDETGYIPFANKAACKLLNLPHLSHVKQLAQLDETLVQRLMKIMPGERQLMAVKQEIGETQFSFSATEFKIEGKNVRIISIQDIKPELDNRELTAWIKLIRVLSHEMINTITPITSLADTLRGYFSSDDSIETGNIQRTKKGLGIIKERGEGLVDFVERYRKLTQIPQPKKEHLSLGELIRKAQILMSGEPDFKNLNFHFDLKPAEVEVFGDEQQLTQVLLNLMKNAMEALRGREHARLEINSWSDAKMTHISIKDNGPGIPNELLEEIFVPFFTTKEKGSGIGLSLCRQIIQMHGGSLGIRSVVGLYTEVQFAILTKDKKIGNCLGGLSA